MQQPQWGGEEHMAAGLVDFWESLFCLTYGKGVESGLSLGAQERHPRDRCGNLLWGECQTGP